MVEGPDGGVPRELDARSGNRQTELGGTAKAVPTQTCRETDRAISKCIDPSSAGFRERKPALPQDDICDRGTGWRIPREPGARSGDRQAELGDTAKAVPYPNRLEN